MLYEVITILLHAESDARRGIVPLDRFRHRQRQNDVADAVSAEDAVMHHGRTRGSELLEELLRAFRVGRIRNNFV